MMNDPKKSSTSVTLPKDLMEEVEKFIKNSNLGYKSKAEFVKEAIRKYLDFRKGLQEF